MIDIQGSSECPRIELGKHHEVHALVALARELHEEGEVEEARDVATDAVLIWAEQPGDLREDDIVQLLTHVHGLDARRILGAILTAHALGPWAPRWPARSTTVAPSAVVR